MEDADALIKQSSGLKLRDFVGHVINDNFHNMISNKNNSGHYFCLYSSLLRKI